MHARFGIRNANLGQHKNGVLDRGRFIASGMRSDDVDELTADREQRIERRFGVLDNQPYLASTDLLQGAVRLAQQIAIVVTDGSRTIRPGGPMRLTSAIAIVDLPAPLSPTMPRISPFPREKSTPLTVLPTPELVVNSTLRSRTSSRADTGLPAGRFCRSDQRLTQKGKSEHSEGEGKAGKH
jgi:hypothetical protein